MQRLELDDLRGNVGAVGVVWDLRRHRDIGGLGGLLNAGGDRGAVIGILVDDGDIVDLPARLLQVGEKFGIGLGKIGRDRPRAEGPFEAAAGDVRCHRVGDQIGNALPFGHRGRYQRHRGVIRAEHRNDVVLRDQAQRLLLPDLRIALMIGRIELDLGAAEIGQPGRRAEWQCF